MNHLTPEQIEKIKRLYEENKIVKAQEVILNSLSGETHWRELESGPALDKLIAYRLGEQPTMRITEMSFTLTASGIELGYTRQYRRFSTDVNIALSLPLPPLHWFILYGPATEDDLWDAEIHDVGPKCWLERSINPALALCRAWLAWKESNDSHA